MRGLDDDVLQHLVDRVAQVQRTVRVRRSVGEDERRATLRGGANLVVQTRALPHLEHARFALRQIAFIEKPVFGKLIVFL